MPIVDIEVVCKTHEQVCAVSAQALADSLGQVFKSEPGHTWIRTYILADSAYAENGPSLDESELPAFVTVAHLRAPVAEALALEVQAITVAVAKCIGRPTDRVHVQYAPPAAARQAFGGKLVE